MALPHHKERGRGPDPQAVQLTSGVQRTESARSGRGDSNVAQVVLKGRLGVWRKADGTCSVKVCLKGTPDMFLRGLPLTCVG